MSPAEFALDELWLNEDSRKILMAAAILVVVVGLEAVLLVRIVRKVRGRRSIPFPDIPWSFDDMWLLTVALLPLLSLPLLALIELARHWLVEKAAGLADMWTDPSALYLFLGSTAVMELAAAIVLLYRGFTRHGLTWGEAGFWLPGWREGLATPLLAVGGYLGAEFLYEGALAAAGLPLAPQLAASLIRSAASPRDWILVIGVAGLLAPVLEEFLFRGFLYQLFKRYVGVGWGMALATFFFALGHLEPPQVSGAWVSLVLRLPEFFALGFLLNWLAHRSGSLVPSMVAHVANNMVGVFILLRG